MTIQLTGLKSHYTSVSRITGVVNDVEEILTDRKDNNSYTSTTLTELGMTIDLKTCGFCAADAILWNLSMNTCGVVQIKCQA